MKDQKVAINLVWICVVACDLQSLAINYIPIWLIVYLEISLVTLKIIDICIIIDIMKQKFEFT